MKFYRYLLLFIVAALHSFCVFSQDFRNQNDEFIQIGYGRYKCLTFGGDSSLVPNWGRYAVEYWGGGLNFWRPWPVPNWANYILYLRDDNNVAIGSTGSSAYKLHINGSVYSTGVYVGSDEKLKRNISSLSECKKKLNKLHGVSYEYLTHKEIPKPTSDKYPMTEAKIKSFEDNSAGEPIYEQGMGFIAQEVKKVFPELVKEDEHGYLSVNYIGIIPYLVEAFKEQQSEIDSLKKIIAKNIPSSNQNSSAKRITVTASLDQNVPNPFYQSTRITYNIESEFNSAEIIVLDFNGEIKKRFSITEKGEGGVILEGGSLNPGTYHYILLVDGMALDSKIAVLLK